MKLHTYLHKFCRLKQWEIKADSDLNVILLSPRGGCLESLFQIHRFLFSGVEANFHFFAVDQWYPIPDPFDPEKRRLSKMGQSLSRDFLSQVVRLSDPTGGKNTIVFGYSAGAVMALDLVTHGMPVRAIVPCAGAILEPTETPIATTNTRIYLHHGKRDDVFDWQERYLPMKSTLIGNGYNLVSTFESDFGGHGIIDLLKGAEKSINSELQKK